MGVDKYTYVGIYFLVKPKKNMVEKVRKTWVSESGNVHHSPIKFDPNDGTVVHENKTTYFEEEINSDHPFDLGLYDFFSKVHYFGEGLGDRTLWLFNFKTKYRFHTEEESIFCLENVNPKEEIEKFKKEFADLLEAIKEQEHFESFEIHYGVITYED